MVLFFVFFLTGGPAVAAEMPAAPESVVVAPMAELSPPWSMRASLSVPMRGFEIRAGGGSEETQDPLRSVSYVPAPSLEGSLQLAYRGLGLRFDRTLAAANLGGGPEAVSSTRNETWHFDFLWENTLYEIGWQQMKGLETDTSAAQTGGRRIARPDLEYRSFGGRVVTGIPFGSDTVNSLANFYARAEKPAGGLSGDLLFSAEFSQQVMAGSRPFIPEERRDIFGTASSLSKLDASGLGLGAGVGLTALMGGQSYFSLAALLGASYNVSYAEYAEGRENVSDWGTFADVRMSVRWIFERHEFGVKLLVNHWGVAAKESRLGGMDALLGANYGVTF